jgi:hypothetical protein
VTIGRGQQREKRHDTSVLTYSADGTDIRAFDEGQGAAIMMLRPGMETGSRYEKVAPILARRFRVIRPHRRQYRVDLKRRIR